MKLTRRNFVKGACAATSLALVRGFSAPLAWADGGGNGTKLLLINLNGGLDGLAALQPLSGSAYSTLASMRPNLAKTPGQLLAADANFGFHPNLSTFKSLFDEGSLTGVLRVGYNNMSRSHFDAEITFARGVPDRLSSSSTGLINRIGSAYNWGDLRAISVSGYDPFFGGGSYSPIQTNSLDDFYYRPHNDDFNDIPNLTNNTYGFNSAASISPANDKGLDYVKHYHSAIGATDLVQAAVDALPTNSVYDESTQFGKAFRSAEIAFRASQIDSEIVYLRRTGFDTHARQINNLDPLLSEFNTAFGTFVSRMKAADKWNNLIVMIFSEFGRTNAENGSQGTDHGGANPVFLAGGPVAGGGFYGGVSATNLTEESWLLPQYNVAEIYRRVLGRIGVDPEQVIPKSAGPQLTGLFT